jgi:hypothetical protein
MSLKTSLIIATLAVAAGFVALNPTTEPEIRTSYIVQGRSLDAVLAAVGELDAEVTHELGVIHAVAANLTDDEADRLRVHSAVKSLYGNDAVEVAGKGGKGGGGGGNYTTVDTHYSSLVNAHAVHATGITGAGIGIAVLDTGLWKHDGIKYDHSGATRLKALYNAIRVEPTRWGRPGWPRHTRRQYCRLEPDDGRRPLQWHRAGRTPDFRTGLR